MVIQETLQNSLVSICVITYNSSAYIIETLDSILLQDYENIELIISDDHSTDDTCEICSNWIKSNHHHFKNCHLAQLPENKGICANYNHVWPLAKGEWIKFIAGDDRLKPDCISSFVKEIEDNIDIMCCLRENFRNDSPKRWISGEEHLRHKDQLKQVLKHHYFGIVCGATLFVKKKLLEDLNGFDERFMFAEDYPLCMKYLMQGKRIKQIEKPLVEYRNYASVSNSGNPRFVKSHNEAMFEYLPKAALYCKMPHYWYHFKVWRLEYKYSNANFAKRLLVYLLKVFDIVNIANKLYFKK